MTAEILPSELFIKLRIDGQYSDIATRRRDASLSTSMSAADVLSVRSGNENKLPEVSFFYAPSAYASVWSPPVSIKPLIILLYESDLCTLEVLGGVAVLQGSCLLFWDILSIVNPEGVSCCKYYCIKTLVLSR